jgi:hypothetical protein
MPSQGESDEEEQPQDDYIGTEIEYNPEFEQLLKENGDHAQVYSILHQMSFIKYKRTFDMCNIPLIVLTAVIGFITGIGLNYEYIGIILGASSVFVSIIKSIVSYLKLSERSENHRICSLQFGQISNEIKIELSLRREQRQPAKILLDVIKVKFKNLMEVAQLIDTSVINQFRSKYLDRGFDEKDVSLPPVFSRIPGIKILGATSEQDHVEQLHKNLEKYIAEKKYEREHLTYELQHIAELRRIREEYRVSDRKVQFEGGEEPSILQRQRSIPLKQNMLFMSSRNQASIIQQQVQQQQQRISEQSDVIQSLEAHVRQLEQHISEEKDPKKEEFLLESVHLSVASSPTGSPTASVELVNPLENTE